MPQTEKQSLSASHNSLTQSSIYMTKSATQGFLGKPPLLAFSSPCVILCVISQVFVFVLHR